MLSRFCVENYRCFKNQISFDLAKIHPEYDFSQNAVKQNHVNKGIIYGFNGCGKSNLGRAMMDLTAHLTDWKKDTSPTANSFLNLDEETPYASFFYDFSFPDGTVHYEYRKNARKELLFEELRINDIPVISYDFKNQIGQISLEGTQSLKFQHNDSPISRVRFVAANAILDDHIIQNKLFAKFMDFVNRMLLFYSLRHNSYIGLIAETERADEYIAHHDLKHFSEFLKDMGLPLNVFVENINGVDTLMVRFKHGARNFASVASTGTSTLLMFYYWYLRMETASFVFMDEFDAFYHFELAEKIVKLLLKKDDLQVLFTTHNTDLLSNDLLRPDCYFYMESDSIKALSDCTEKDLRKAHNLQKMFKAGAFSL